MISLFTAVFNLFLPESSK